MGCPFFNDSGICNCARPARAASPAATNLYKEQSAGILPTLSGITNSDYAETTDQRDKVGAYAAIS
jgi:hypothetical protein